MAIKVGTVFRVNEINFRYQIDCQENSTKSHDELLELSKNMLYVVTGFNDTRRYGCKVSYLCRDTSYVPAPS